MTNPVNVKIKFKSTSVDQFVERYAVDVSQGGIFIRTPKPLAVGTSLQFEFQLQDGSELMSGLGTVVWVRDNDPVKPDVAPGMGVRFDELPPGSRDVVKRVLARKGSSPDLGNAVAGESNEVLGESADSSALPVAPNGAEKATTEMAMATAQALQIQEATAVLDSGNNAGSADTAGQEPAEAPALQPAQHMPPSASSDGLDPKDLEQFLFAGEDADVNKAPAHDGATPLTPEMASAEDDEAGLLDPSVDDFPAAGRKKSSLIGLWVVVVLAAAGGFVYWKFFMPKRSAKGALTQATDAGGAQAAPKPDTVPATTTQRVESTPSGAKIIVNGEDTGKVTPATLDKLQIGTEVDIALDLAGKKLHRVKTQPDANTALSVDLDIDAERRVVITSVPEGATVSAGRKKLGQTPVDLEPPLEPGEKRTLRLRLAGHKAQVATISLNDLTWQRDGDDEKAVFSVTLEAVAAADPPPAATDPKPATKARPLKAAPKPSTATPSRRAVPAKTAGAMAKPPTPAPARNLPKPPVPTPGPDDRADSPATPPAPTRPVKPPPESIPDRVPGTDSGGGSAAPKAPEAKPKATEKKRAKGKGGIRKPSWMQ